MMTREHPLWERLSGFGFQDRLRAIADDPCPPDIIGINHYLTSDRFLDHRLHRYPAHSHGGSDTQLYADVEAIRVLEPPPQGLEGALRERSEEHTSELQSLMRISYAVFCLKKKKKIPKHLDAKHRDMSRTTVHSEH